MEVGLISIGVNESHDIDRDARIHMNNLETHSISHHKITTYCPGLIFIFSADTSKVSGYGFEYATNAHEILNLTEQHMHEINRNLRNQILQ
jgi:hypothetical protein